MITKGPEQWQHQKDALRFIHARRGTLLWVEMGLGKSRIVVDYVQNAVPDGVLIICPLKVVSIWPREFQKYYNAPDRMIIPLDTDATVLRARRIETAPKDAIIVINYDAIRSHAIQRAILNRQWGAVILDECHRVKAPNGITSKKIALICERAKKVIGLSGTPLGTGTKTRQGKLVGGWRNIYGQARAIAPGVYPRTHTRFKEEYGVWAPTTFPLLLDDKNMDDFHKKLDSFTFNCATGAIALPAATDQIVTVELPPAARAAYDKLEKEFITDYNEETMTAPNALVKQLRLAQLTSGYYMPDETRQIQRIHSAKIEAITEILEDIPENEKIVIFCRFKAEMDELFTNLSHHAKTYTLRGGIDTSEQWKADKNGGILIVQISAGGCGLDFTDARYCFYNSLCFSMIDYEQSRKRIHRPGQQRPVTYFHMVTKNTIDEAIYTAIETKSDVVATVRDHIIDRSKKQ